jgi:hypothetical protein
MATVKKLLSIEAQKERDAKPVTGKFKYPEKPGDTLTFPYRKYPKEPIKIWKFTDGQVYTIPKGIANHLQKEGKYIVHEHCLDANGMPSMRIGHVVDRFNFEIISFTEDDDDSVKPNLYTAEVTVEKKFIRPSDVK